MKRRPSHIKRIKPSAINKEELDSYTFTTYDLEPPRIGGYSEYLRSVIYQSEPETVQAGLDEYYLTPNTKELFLENVVNKINNAWKSNSKEPVGNAKITHSDYKVNGNIDVYQAILISITNMIKRSYFISSEISNSVLRDGLSRSSSPVTESSEANQSIMRNIIKTKIEIEKLATVTLDETNDDKIMKYLNGFSVNDLIVYFFKMYGTMVDNDLYVKADEFFNKSMGTKVDGTPVHVSKEEITALLTPYSDVVVWSLPEDRYEVGSITNGRIQIDPLYGSSEPKILVLVPDGESQEIVDYVLASALNDNAIDYNIRTTEEIGISNNIFE